MTEKATQNTQGPKNHGVAGPTETEEITLKKAHVHNRIPCVPGDKLLVRPDQAKRLKAVRVAE